MYNQHIYSTLYNLLVQISKKNFFKHKDQKRRNETVNILRLLLCMYKIPKNLQVNY